MAFGNSPAGWLAIGIAAWVVAALLLIPATRLVLGGATGLFNALLVVIASAVASWIATYAVGYVLLDVLNMPDLMLASALLVGAISAIATYMLLLRRADGRRPSILQAALIYVITMVLALLVCAGCVLLAVYVFHVPVPDFSRIV